MALTKQEQNVIITDIIKKEYKKRAELISNLISHIERLTTEHIISLNENTRYMHLVDEIMRILNISCYNAINSVKGNCDEIEIDEEGASNILVSSNIDNFFAQSKYFNSEVQSLYLAKINDSSYLYDDNIRIFNFTDIDNLIKDLTVVVGGKNIYDILAVYSKIPYILLFTDELQLSLLNVLQQSFIPLFVTQSEKSDFPQNTVSISTCSKIPAKYEILLNNFYKVKLHVPNCKYTYFIEVYGFFEYDCINARIKTSEICNKLISKKRKNFAQTNVKRKQIPSDFKELHINNLTIGEILSNDEKTYGNLLTNDYALFLKFSTMPFRQLHEEFIQSSLEDKFKMIKILLFAHNYANETDTHYVNNAGLLFGSVKESKMNTDVIADVIYKHLNLLARSKLSKPGSAIKYEIEKLKNLDADDIDLKKQLMMNPNIPDKIKKLVLTKLSEMKSANSEYYKQLIYVKTLIDFPWIEKNNSDIFSMYGNDNSKKKELILSVKAKLNEKVHGHTECKETIIELMGKWFSNPKGMGKAIGLLGPPGVGKTLIAKKLSEALGIPFAQINLGGMEDGSILSGHSITYSGAVPGLIVKKMVEAGRSRCILFFDELDKTAFHHGRNEIQDTLMHVIDATSNSEFTDKFFQEVKFPINKVLFVFSFNDKDKIDRILLDRMEIINIESYSSEDKVNIMSDFLIKDLKDDFGFNDYDISISKENALYLIESYTMEAGVRNIKRKLEKIFSGLNMDRLMGTGIFSSDFGSCIDISRQLIDKYIKNPKLNVKKVNTIPKIGNVNGLYATSMGTGGVIPILIYQNHDNNNKFKLKLTGKQGHVMKESVQFAFTIACNLIQPEYLNVFFEKYRHGLHVHTPDGATTKDGPSAGSAFTLAFISVILNKKIKNDIGLTGEIDQDGCISAVGGLENKLPGAKKAGIKLVFVPKENEREIEKLKVTHVSLFDSCFKCIPVDHITEVVDLALIEDSDFVSVSVYKKSFDHGQYIKEHASVKKAKKENIKKEKVKTR